MKIQNLWALPRSYQNCVSSTAVASPASCELERKEQIEKRVKSPGLVQQQQPAPRCLSREELTTRTELAPAAAPSGHPSQLQINRSCPATKHCVSVSAVSTAAKASAARTTTNNSTSAPVLYPNIFCLRRIPTQAQQAPPPPLPSPTEELLPSSADSTVAVISTATAILCNSNSSSNSNVLAAATTATEPPFLNCNTSEEEKTKNAIGNSGCSVIGSTNIAALVTPACRKNQDIHQTANSGSRRHRHSVFSCSSSSSAHRNCGGNSDNFCSSGATSSVSPQPSSTQPHRSSSSTPTSASTVFSIGPSCFAKLKRIVTSVRRSRSSSARMSVSGTKRKSSPPTFQSPTSSGRSVLSNEGAASGPGALEDQDDSPSNPTKMRRRQTSQPSTRSLLTPSVASTITNCLSKSLESPTHSSTASSNAVVSGALPFHQHVSSSSSPQSKSRFIPDVYSNNVHFFSRLRKSRKDSNSIVAAVPLSDVQRKEFELPFKLRVQLDQPPISHEAQLKHSWNDQDKSLNIVILPHTNSLIFRRYPVAQSTDCIRGKIGFSSGLHIWEIKWPVNQRGTHAVIGVATKDAPLHCSGYKSLIGSNGESWGWDIGRSKLMHDYTNNQPKVYPSHILDKDEIIIVPEKVTVILDMDEGTLAYMVDGQYLGVAFSGLKQSNKPLYPIVSAVWGHCEVEMTYLHASQAMTMQSIARYQIRRYLRQLFYQLKHSLSSATVFDSNNQFGEINSNNNGNCTAGTTLPPSVTAALFNQITSSSSSAIDIVNSSTINYSALPISACSNMPNTHCTTNNSSATTLPPNNPGDATPPSGAGTSSSGSSSSSANNSGSTQNNLSSSGSPSTAGDSCVNAAATMSELSKKLFPSQPQSPHTSQQSMLAAAAASDLIQMVPLNTGINVPEWLFKSSSAAAAMGGASPAVGSAQACKDLNNSMPGFVMQPPQLSVMSPLCSLSFTGLPPGCNTDSQFIEYHVERLQIPTCLKHYLI